MTTSTVEEPGMGKLDIFPIETTESNLTDFLTYIFNEAWNQIQFGLLIQGSVMELSPPNKPEKISVFDGYMTVDFGPFHTHFCIGETVGTGVEVTPEDVAKIRTCARAELYRKLNKKGEPVFWAFRMFNGANEQMLTVFLPNPLLTDKMDYAKKPDWSKLNLWDELRRRFVGMEPEAKDRTAKRFTHD